MASCLPLPLNLLPIQIHQISIIYNHSNHEPIPNYEVFSFVFTKAQHGTTAYARVCCGAKAHLLSFLYKGIRLSQSCLRFDDGGLFFIRILSQQHTKSISIIEMCGRLFQTLPLSRLLRIARTSRVSNQEFHSMSYNVCPTTYIPVIKNSRIYGEAQQDKTNEEQSKPLDERINEAANEEGSEGGQEGETKQSQNNDSRELTFMRWGQKTNYNMIINGRIEEMCGKRTFVKLIENRCVVIMEGYYEWKSKEEPFCFKPKNSDHFLVAGLYTDENEIIILTKDATPELAKVHERMPVILTHGEVELWLDPKNTKDINAIIQKSLTNQNKPLWKNIGFAKLAPYVNKREEKSNKCLMTIEDYKKELDNKGLMRFWKKKEPVEAVSKEGETLKQKPTVSDKQEKSQISKKDPTSSSQLPQKQTFPQN